jgi:hypothetical protein
LVNVSAAVAPAFADPGTATIAASANAPAGQTRPQNRDCDITRSFLSVNSKALDSIAHASSQLG